MKVAPQINTMCVTMNKRKMGVSVSTDSRTPRRFKTSRKTMNRTSTGSFQAWYSTGNKLKRASPAAAIEIVMVST